MEIRLDEVWSGSGDGLGEDRRYYKEVIKKEKKKIKHSEHIWFAYGLVIGYVLAMIIAYGVK